MTNLDDAQGMNGFRKGLTDQTPITPELDYITVIWAAYYRDLDTKIINEAIRNWNRPRPAPRTRAQALRAQLPRTLLQ